MYITDTELKDKLETMAFDVTDNFCYGCYKVVKGEKCPSCGTDDFMRHLGGVGVEYGTDWVIEHLIKEHCSPIDAEDLYEDLLNDTYGTVKVAGCEWEAGHVVREMDPTTFRCGVSDMLSDEDQYIEADGDYYQVSDVENMIDELT